MNSPRVRHATVVCQRAVAAPPARAFEAFADLRQRRQWDVPGDGWVMAEFTHDFRVGGEEVSRFGPPGNPHICNRDRYLDIVPNERFVVAGTVSDGDTATSSTLFTVEFFPDDVGTRVVFTDQSVYYDPRDRPDEREKGWNQILDKLVAFLLLQLQASSHGVVGD